jgi:DNA polymerase-1
MGKKMSEKKLRQRLYSQAINTPVQGTCADIIKMAMNRCCAAGYIPLLQIHDELLFEVEESKAEQVAESISKIMTGVFEGQCKLNVEVKIGDNWGDLS